MSVGDKFEAAADKLKGKVEEAVGRLTHDDSKIAEGKAHQVKGGIKDKVADAKAHLKDTASESDTDVRNETDDTEGGGRL